MIYDDYCMAVLFKLQAGPQPISSLYHTSNQHGKLEAMMAAGLMMRCPEGVEITYKGHRVYDRLFDIAEMIGDTGYQDKAAHIDKMNRRRLEQMQAKHRRHRSRGGRGSGCGGRREDICSINAIYCVCTLSRTLMLWLFCTCLQKSPYLKRNCISEKDRSCSSMR